MFCRGLPENRTENNAILVLEFFQKMKRYWAKPRGRLFPLRTQKQTQRAIFSRFQSFRKKLRLFTEKAVKLKECFQISWEPCCEKILSVWPYRLESDSACAPRGPGWVGVALWVLGGCRMLGESRTVVHAGSVVCVQQGPRRDTTHATTESTFPRKTRGAFKIFPSGLLKYFCWRGMLSKVA